MGILVRQMTVIERRSEYPLVANSGSTDVESRCRLADIETVLLDSLNGS
jgi:hypothetical protein